MTQQAGNEQPDPAMAELHPPDRESVGEALNDDFPFYNGRPRIVTGRQWCVVMALVIVGYLVLVLPIVPLPAGVIGGFARALLFSVIPLAGLAGVAGKDWTGVFRAVRATDILWMAAFAGLSLVVTLSTAFFVSGAIGAQANPAFRGLAARTGTDLAVFFLRTGLQIFGEEVITILPFLALMYWLTARLRVRRRSAIIVAMIISAIFFGLLHLPSYNWNLVQVLVIIGLARVILTLSYIKTKNMWVSTGAHVLNDWAMFGMTVLFGRLAGG